MFFIEHLYDEFAQGADNIVLVFVILRVQCILPCPRSEGTALVLYHQPPLFCRKFTSRRRIVI